MRVAGVAPAALVLCRTQQCLLLPEMQGAALQHGHTASRQYLLQAGTGESCNVTDFRADPFSEFPYFLQLGFIMEHY